MTALMALLLAGLFTTSYFHQAAALNLGTFTATIPEPEISLAIQKDGTLYSAGQEVSLCQEPDSCYLTADIDTSFNVSGPQPAQLYFEIQTDSNEYLNGFDRPYLSVFIDNQVVYEENFHSNLTGLGEWRQVWILLPHLYDGSHSLKITQTNTGDNLHAVNVVLKDISTNIPLLGAGDQLVLTTDDIQATIEVEVVSQSGRYHLSAAGSLNIQSQELASNSTITYWLENNGVEINQRQTISVNVDLQPPQQVNVLEDKFESDGSTTLRVAASEDIHHYEFRPDESDWQLKSFSSAEDVLSIPFQSPLLEIRVSDYAGNKSAWQPIYGGAPL